MKNESVNDEKDNYNIYEVNYDIQAIGLKKGSFFPSINHECYYDAQILSCEINGL